MTCAGRSRSRSLVLPVSARTRRTSSGGNVPAITPRLTWSLRRMPAGRPAGTRAIAVARPRASVNMAQPNLYVNSIEVSPEFQNFRCWGCSERGDVFDFVMAAERVDMPTAVKRVLELVDGDRPDPAAEAARAARRAAVARQDALEAAQRTAQARQILAESEPLTLRTGGLPVPYLVEPRGITQGQPRTLRWHPRCPWGASTAGCIVVPVENVAGDVTGVWRIRPTMEGKVRRLGL